ncbi:MAG: hypothetical protein ACSLEL_02470 [Candidatus Malihini olakiniferum]
MAVLVTGIAIPLIALDNELYILLIWFTCRSFPPFSSVWLA